MKNQFSDSTTEKANQRVTFSSLLERPDEIRYREYKYRFSQAVIFGIPVLALQWKGPSLGGPEAQRWIGIMQALLAGWVIHVGATGMLFEGLILLRQKITLDFFPAMIGVGLYLYSLVSVTHVFFTGHLWYQPLLFHWGVTLLILWTGLQWFRWSRRR